MVVLGIAAAVAIPYAVATSDSQARSAARNLETDLQYAQNYAITHQMPVSVTFDASAESYSLSNASGTLIHPMSKSEYVIQFGPDQQFDDVDIVSAGFGADGGKVTFDELGAPESPGTVVIQAGPHVYEVSVKAATGKITLNRQGS